MIGVTIGKLYIYLLVNRLKIKTTKQSIYGRKEKKNIILFVYLR